MSTYEEMAPERKKARALYLELAALRVRLHLREDPHNLAEYKMGLSRLHSVPKPDVLKVLLSRWDSDLGAVREEGGTA